MNADWLNALLGGSIIGLAVSLMLLWNGRVTGISGIVYGLFHPVKNDIQWRVTFILGLVAGGLFYQFTANHVTEIQTTGWKISVAGLLVGFGTVLGSGCTSGHGVCGISRLSVRSILATIIFILAGVLTVGALNL